jgi:hypothetical protein
MYATSTILSLSLTRRSIETFAWEGFCGRLVVAVIPEHMMLANVTLEQMYARIRWSFDVLGRGVWPQRGFDGEDCCTPETTIVSYTGCGNNNAVQRMVPSSSRCYRTSGPSGIRALGVGVGGMRGGLTTTGAPNWTRVWPSRL